jgi:hypothetical protein
MQVFWKGQLCKPCTSWVSLLDKLFSLPPVARYFPFASFFCRLHYFPFFLVQVILLGTVRLGFFPCLDWFILLYGRPITVWCVVVRTLCPVCSASLYDIFFMLPMVLGSRTFSPVQCCPMFPICHCLFFCRSHPLHRTGPYHHRNPCSQWRRCLVIMLVLFLGEKSGDIALPFSKSQ